ncbi:MAG: hypothetical protein KC519_20270, partial [Anaerolineae bacterium]|nr:hypothetical protein [Anaerolineae bacterium]
GWTKRAVLKLSEFLDDEKRHQERLTWLQQNWSRSIELKQWIDGLIEMDARREWEEMRYGRSPIPNVTYMSTSDLETASNNLKAQLATDGDIQDWVIRRRIEREQAIESQNRANDREKFFNMTYELSDDDFMLLKVYVHQLRTQRDKGNERACTSIDAARMLSSLTGKTVTEATYRKRIERFRKNLPINPGTGQPYDIEIWVKWRYL